MTKASDGPVTVPVSLTVEEVDLAWSRAKAQAKGQTKPDVFEHKGDKLRTLANEHAAKIAVAKHCGGTIPPRVRVRSKAWGDHLILRPALCDRNAHLLVVGAVSGREMALVGWRWGFECARPERWDHSLKYPAYRWPRETLRDVSTLLAALEAGEQLSLDGSGGE